MNMNDYLRTFILGSSWPVFALFYILIYFGTLINQFTPNWSYKLYSILAPVYFGLMNMLSLYLSRIYKLSLRNRFILIAIISAILINLGANIFQAYNFDQARWYRYYFNTFIRHGIAYTMLYLIEKYFSE